MFFERTTAMRLESISMDKPVSFKDLPNGMRYYGRFDRVANASGIGAKCGAIHTPPGKTGLPHFVEHTLCRATRKYTVKEIDLTLRLYLGSGDDDWNVRIDRNSTFYGHLMLLRPSHMRICFDIFANMLRDRMIDQQGHLVEQSRIHNEYYLRGLDVIDELLWDTIHDKAYQRNPARHRIDCIPDELQSISAQELIAFTKKYYVPRNMFMIVLGPRFKVAERMAYKYFSDWPDLPAPKPDFDLQKCQELISGQQVHIVERPGIGQHHVMLGFNAEKFGSPNHYSLQVLVQILELLLVDELQEHDRGVYRSPVMLSQSKYHGLITASFATKDPEFVEESVARITKACKQLQENLVDPEVFKSALYRVYYEYIGPFVNDANKLLEMIIDSAANGDEDLVILHSGKQALESVTRERIRALADRFLTQDFLTVHIRPA